MARHRVVAMPGDGIGRIVLPEAIRVLKQVGFDAEYLPADIGGDYWVSEGEALPDRTVELQAQHKLGLFGAITSKPKRDAERELSPALQGKGCVYFSPIVGLRQRFHLDVCIRPCIGFPGNPLNFIRQKRGGGWEAPQINAVIFRQNTEGLYSGVEWTDPPAAVRESLALHGKFEPFRAVAGPDLAIAVRCITRQATRRIVRAAFEYARKHGCTKVTICEKPNVLRETSGLIEEEARLVAADFPGIRRESVNIDAQMMWLSKNPEDYQVIVASNLFGDIVSDAFAGLVGGLGFACSANIGDEAAVFEPDALELKDMPSRFSLFLTGGTRIYIRPKARGFFPRLGNIGHLLAWYVGAPLTNLTFELRKKPFAAIEVVLPQKEDAQALYWAFPEGVKGLIYPL